MDGQPTPPASSTPSTTPTPSTSPTPTAPDDGGAQWRVRGAAGEFGPVDLATLRMWVQQRRVGRTDFVYNPVTSTWGPASGEPRLAYLFPSQSTPSVPYRGVRGWLLFFCVSLTILSPLETFITFVGSHDESVAMFKEMPRLVTLFIVDGVVSAGLMLFSISAGVMLWCVRPNAVTVAKAYLWAYFVYICASTAVLVTLFPYVLDDAAQTAELMGDLIRDLIYFGIWYAYLSASKRAKATYGV